MTNRSLRVGRLGLLIALAACEGAPPPPVEAGAEPTAQVAGWGKADSPGALISHLDHGTWVDPDRQGRWRVTSAWVTARVINHRYDKRVFVEVEVPYQDGSRLRSLWPLAYQGRLGDAEAWGTDAIVTYPNGGPFGARQAGPAGARLRVQHDAGGREAMWVGPWFTLDADDGFEAQTEDPWADLSDASSEGAGEGGGDFAAFFGPIQDPGRPIVDAIDAVIAAQRADPTGRHTIDAAVFDLNDREIVDRLLAAHQAGVIVRVITDADKVRPWATWLDGDDRLRRAGVPVLARHVPGGAMHLKLGLFDGQAMTTGSANWSNGARTANDEYTLWTDDPTIYASYAAAFRALAGGAEVTVGPAAFDRATAGRVIELIDQAEASIELAMFTAKDYERMGRTVFDALHDAIARGVDVTLITDARFADSDTDERLEAAGAHVVRADPAAGAAMHHKFAVFDGRRVAVGALNWYYDALFANAEDLLVLEDPAMVALFAGEIVDLQARYDATFDPADHPSAPVEFAVDHAGTRYGETVVVVGGLAALGDWQPTQAVRLDGSAWPTWRGTVELPVGRHFEWKLAVVGPFGVRFEAGPNRTLRVAPENEITATWR